ncbi:MAG TPA: thioredoxin domain-containing protein [Bryobacteraceae bacterium]|nr:thioredoxin domain-containing protein [Bryobacteraceae bacterium]
MKSFMRFAGTVALPLVLMLPAAPAADKAKPDAAKEQGITREQADQILEELRQIHQLLERQQQQPAKPPAPPQPARAQIDLNGAEMLGSPTAPITVVEFTDYQCPFCQRFHLSVFGDMKKYFIDTGKVRFYSRDLPLDSIHPNAMRAAMSARCAAEQGQFWKLRDIMGANPGKLELADLVDDAASLKMDTAAFRACVESGKYREAVQSNVLEAMKFGIGGTPSFVVGKTTPEGVDGEVVEGALPLAEFAKVFAKVEAGK